MKKIVLTGGGTLGHVTPHLALIPRLQAEGYEIHYVGTAEGMEAAKMQSIPGPDSNAPGLRGHFAFYRVKNVKCYNFTCNDCEGGQYCWHAVDFDGLLLDGFTIRGKKDGVHLNLRKNSS